MFKVKDNFDTISEVFPCLHVSENVTCSLNIKSLTFRKDLTVHGHSSRLVHHCGNEVSKLDAFTVSS